LGYHWLSAQEALEYGMIDEILVKNNNQKNK
jgi:ATP-dependent protease ClpP protease subunit